MFLLRLIQYVLSYVRFRAEGGSPERFLNLAAKNDIALWHIRMKDGVLHACTLSRSFRRLHPFAVESGVVLYREEKAGLAVQLGRFRRQAGVAAGLFCFVALVWFFSSFIWEIDVAGNTSVSAAQVQDTLADLGLKPGAFSSFLQVRYIQNGLLLRIPELSGVTINLHGSTAYVRVRERRYAPEVVPASQPCNIKASRDGRILQMITYEGKPLVKAGEAVTAGQLLISGIVQDQDGATRILHAQGAALAQTARDLSVTVPLRTTEPRETGVEVKRYALDVFDYEVPLYFGALKGEYHRYIRTQNAELFGVKLPILLVTRTYRAVRPEKVTYTAAQALSQAKKELGAKEKAEWSGVKLVSQTTSSKTEDSNFTLTVHAVCEEDIALTEAIQIS